MYGCFVNMSNSPVYKDYILKNYDKLALSDSFTGRSPNLKEDSAAFIYYRPNFTVRKNNFTQEMRNYPVQLDLYYKLRFVPLNGSFVMRDQSISISNLVTYTHVQLKLTKYDFSESIWKNSWKTKDYENTFFVIDSETEVKLMGASTIYL